jgi:hypothetical protein
LADELDKKEEATTPEPEYSAADALKEGLEAEPPDTEESDDSKVVTADEDKTEDKTEETEDEEDPKKLDNEDDEDNDLPELDDTIRKALGDNAEALAVWDRQWKGVQKRERRLSEREESLRSDEKGFQTYQGVSFALFQKDPETAQKCLADLTKAVNDHWKIAAKEEKEEPVTDEATGTIQYDGKTFYSQTELELYQEIQELKAKKEPAPDPFIEELRQRDEQAKTEKALASWVDSNSQSIIAKVAAKTGGWGVTKEQIGQAAKANKEALEKDPVAALKAQFPDAWGDYRAGSKPKKEVRDMVDSSQAKGFKIPDNPDEYTAAHALMEVG